MTAVKVFAFAALLFMLRASALESAIWKRLVQEDSVAAAPAPAAPAKAASTPEFGGTPGSSGKHMVPRTHVHGEGTEKKHEWSYAEPDWGDSFEQCGNAAQSPIDIRSTDVTIGYKPRKSSNQSSKDTQSGGLYQYMSYKPLDGRTIVNHGHNVQVNGEFGDLKLPDGIYEVKQFHFHFPSEHMIDGKHADGEMHIVHQRKNSSGTKDLAVVGLLFQKKDGRVQFSGYQFSGFEDGGLPKEGEEKPIKGAVDLNIFAKQLSNSYYHYFGSLTTPPCSETVHWYVMKNPAIISDEFVESFKKLFPKPANNRPVTPLNGRTIIFSEVALPGEYGPSSDEFANSISQAASKFAAGSSPAPASTRGTERPLRSAPPEGLSEGHSESTQSVDRQPVTKSGIKWHYWLGMPLAIAIIVILLFVSLRNVWV